MERHEGYGILLVILSKSVQKALTSPGASPQFLHILGRNSSGRKNRKLETDVFMSLLHSQEKGQIGGCAQ